MENKNFDFNNKIQIKCRVACRNWHLLSNFQGEEINIVEHLSELIPDREGIGLVTYQNGIQNCYKKDHLNMGHQIIENLKPENPLCIGFYNETLGKYVSIHHDYYRIQNEWQLNPVSMLNIRQLLYTFADKFQTIRPKTLWLHIAHSEAGLILNEVLTTREYGLGEHLKKVNKHFIAATYGAVAPVPDADEFNGVKFGPYYAINTYSEADITMRYAKIYLEKVPSKGDNLPYNSRYQHPKTKFSYYLKIVKALQNCIGQSIVEHAFNGDTYKQALSDDIYALREEHRII